MEQIYKILQELRPGVNFKEETSLIDDGILDSFDIVALVGELNEAFNIVISVEDLVPENFNSVEAIMALVNKLRSGE